LVIRLHASNDLRNPQEIRSRFQVIRFRSYVPARIARSAILEFIAAGKEAGKIFPVSQAPFILGSIPNAAPVWKAECRRTLRPSYNWAGSDFVTLESRAEIIVQRLQSWSILQQPAFAGAKATLSSVIIQARMEVQAEGVQDSALCPLDNSSTSLATQGAADSPPPVAGKDSMNVDADGEFSEEF